MADFVAGVIVTDHQIARCNVQSLFGNGCHAEDGRLPVLEAFDSSLLGVRRLPA